VPVAAGSGVTAVAAGYTFALALKGVGVAPGVSGVAPVGVVGVSYSFGFGVSGDPVPAVSVSSGVLPPGLMLSSDGVLSGTPTVAGSFSFVVSAVNGVAPDASVPVTVQVGSVPTIAGGPPAGLVGQAYSYTYLVGGDPAPTVSVSSGVLPPGVSLSAGGVLSGTPTAAGSYTFEVTASNVAGSVSVSSTLVVEPVNTSSKADVAVSISGPAQVTKGAVFTWRVSVKNVGPAAAKKVVTVVRVPDGVQVLNTAGATRTGQLLVWSTPSIGKNATVTFDVQVKGVQRGVGVLAAVTGAMGSPDPKLGNNITLKLINIK